LGLAVSHASRSPWVFFVLFVIMMAIRPLILPAPTWARESLRRDQSGQTIEGTQLRRWERAGWLSSSEILGYGIGRSKSSRFPEC
jgi:hypothetical protein